MDQLQRTIEELDRLLGSDGLPHAQGVPLMIGGDGDRMPRLTAEHADIAAVTGARLVPGSTTGQLLPVGAGELEESVACYRRLAAGRKEPAELNLLIQQVTVTDDRADAVRPLVERVPGATVEGALELAILLVGTVDQIVAQVPAQRERYGFTYLTVLEPYMEAFAPVVAELGGH
ncbi:hypothetical protein ACIBW9_07865 [Streptomyces sp. NPDC049541]|uniref:hypothetical protein n=1 Tax=Streptomyces sp. NPDC049541 TaxID=3365594 RepID=UPI0037927814